ncbi:hypothetical protein DSM107007_30720 [Nostoc sp. PCC 7120 = FACHB-418]|nr:hypothetical protein DSM107007_30720 [Nostoc sp. PCC 7120 = FACHB-418]
MVWSAYYKPNIIFWVNSIFVNAPNPTPAIETINVAIKACHSVNPSDWKSILAKRAAEMTSNVSRNTRNQAIIIKNKNAPATATKKLLILEASKTLE